MARMITFLSIIAVGFFLGMRHATAELALRVLPARFWNIDLEYRIVHKVLTETVVETEGVEK